MEKNPKRRIKREEQKPQLKMRLKKVVQTFRKYSLGLKSKLKEKANAATKSLDQNNRNACDLQPKKNPET